MTEKQRRIDRLPTREEYDDDQQREAEIARASIRSPRSTS